MKTGEGRVLLDPYEFLPNYGESRVDLSKAGSELRVRIEYDGSDNLPASKTMIFEGVVAFQMALFPGVDMLRRDYGGLTSPLLDGLIEFPDSELAAAWRARFHSINIKHFEMHFLKANQSLIVFATRFSLVSVS